MLVPEAEQLAAVALNVGVLGVLGAAFTVTAEPVAIHVLSDVERTFNV